MAMTKKEREHMDHLRMLAALRWTASVLPDVPPPKTGTKFDSFSSGWTYNVSGMWVKPAWSSTISHGIGASHPEPQRCSSSQGAMNLYSSKLRALRALRHAVERDAAIKLRRIDMLIEDEEAQEAYYE